MAFELSMLHKNKNIFHCWFIFSVIWWISKPKLPRFIRNLFENPIFGNHFSIDYVPRKQRPTIINYVISRIHNGNEQIK